jgi:hypothetical protein
MNTSIPTSLLAITLALAPFSLLAAPAGLPVVAVDCADPALPTHAEISRLIGSNNAAHAYQQRIRLMTIVQRACKRGAGHVHVVRALPAKLESTGAPLAARP